MTKKRRLVAWLLLLLAGSALLVPNLVIHFSTSSMLYRNTESVPPRQVALVLGTSPYTRSGRENPFFSGRVDTAAELYRLGKVERVIVSGSNPSPYYNEPEVLEAALVLRGVPKEAITRDAGGDDTFLSVLRARDSGSTITIVTQAFHAPRAVYLAQGVGLEAIALAAQNVPGATGLSVELREFFARVKAFYEIALFHLGIVSGT